MVIRYLFLIYFICFTQWCQANLDQLFKERIATTLQSVSLYQDSSFSAKVHHTFSEGEMLEIIGETKIEHEDDSQNQRFKWYKVKNKQDQLGWIFGDAIAVIVPDQRIEDQLKVVHKQKVSFDNGFENAVMWIGALEGHDNFNPNNFLNPVYRETYLVITNDKHKSVFMRCSGASTQGSNSVHTLDLKDISGDETPEIILMTKSQSVGTPIENRHLQIFSFQAGTLSNVFEERLTLTYGNDSPSPSLYKHIDIETSLIRVSYIDYLKCKQSKLAKNEITIQGDKARCLEYITATYIWDDFQKRFLPMYEESHTYPRAGVRYEGVALREKPDSNSKKIGKISKSEVLRVIQHIEQFSMVGSRKKVDHYLFVQLRDGSKGFVKAQQIGFVENEHAQVLNAYYQNPPLSRMDWRPKSEFLNID